MTPRIWFSTLGAPFLLMMQSGCGTDVIAKISNTVRPQRSSGRDQEEDMSRLRPPPEHHFVNRVGWLREPPCLGPMMELSRPRA